MSRLLLTNRTGKFDAAKYKALYMLDISPAPVDIKTLAIYSSVLVTTLYCLMPKWYKWGYISPVVGQGWALSNHGDRFLQAANAHLPNAAELVNEISRWQEVALPMAGDLITLSVRRLAAKQREILAGIKLKQTNSN